MKGLRRLPPRNLRWGPSRHFIPHAFRGSPNEFGPGQAGTEAIKRLRSTPQTWRFESDNPKYPAFEVSREEHPYPILGVFVGVV